MFPKCVNGDAVKSETNPIMLKQATQGTISNNIYGNAISNNHFELILVYLWAGSLVCFYTGMEMTMAVSETQFPIDSAIPRYHEHREYSNKLRITTLLFVSAVERFACIRKWWHTHRAHGQTDFVLTMANYHTWIKWILIWIPDEFGEMSETSKQILTWR